MDGASLVPCKTQALDHDRHGMDHKMDRPRQFLCFMEYESMELDIDLQYILFKNVRLLPQPPLITEADHNIVWPFANFYFGSTHYDNLALISRDGAIRRMTIHRPCLTTGNHKPRTTETKEDPIEEWDD